MRYILQADYFLQQILDIEFNKNITMKRKTYFESHN